MGGIFLLKGDFIWNRSLSEFMSVRDGIAVCRDGKCLGVFGQEELPAEYRNKPLEDFTGKLIIPGFTDLHIHAPQYAFRGLGMDMELLKWLEVNAFPEERKFEDLSYAEKAYGLFTESLKRSGTTRAVIFGTLHTDATLLLMKKMEESGLISLVGKINMDRNCPDILREKSAEESLQETEHWIAEWKKLGQKHTKPVLTPRFIPSCSDELMNGLGRIAVRENIPVQSHLSENHAEIELVKKLCPQSTCYGDAYRRAGVLDSAAGSVMAHCVWCPEEEIGILKKCGTFIAHCPASNTNIASGIAPVRKYLEEGLPVGLGTDVAGGHTESVLDSIREAVQVSKLYWRLVDSSKKPLTMPEAFYLATKGGGKFFGKAGGFDAGYPFDALVLDESQIKTTRDDLKPEERLERFVYLACDRDILHKYAEGKQIF